MHIKADSLRRFCPPDPADRLRFYTQRAHHGGHLGPKCARIARFCVIGLEFWASFSRFQRVSARFGSVSARFASVLSDILRLARDRARIGEDVRRRAARTAVARMSRAMRAVRGGRRWSATGGFRSTDSQSPGKAFPGLFLIPPHTHTPTTSIARDVHPLVVARARLGTSRLARPFRPHLGRPLARMVTRLRPASMGVTYNAAKPRPVLDLSVSGPAARGVCFPLSNRQSCTCPPSFPSVLAAASVDGQPRQNLTMP